MMKVAIIGILERQAKFAGEFPNLDIMYINNKKSGDGLKHTAAINKCDRILVVTKFISHKATEVLDRSKIQWINGGVTRIRECLERLNAMAPILEKPAPPQLDFNAELPDAPPMPSKAPMSKPPKPKQYDFTPLYSAQVGTLVTFPKPEGVSREIWRSRVSAILNYAKRKYGLVTEVEHKNGEAHILVTATVPPVGVKYSPKAKKTPPAKKAAPSKPEAVTPPLPSMVETVLASTEGVALAAGIWREAYLEHANGSKALNNPKDSTRYASDVANEFLNWYTEHTGGTR